ncbi:MAG TPA: CDP-diacylglycerol--serine O-phosphatidyltransferase [Bryobacteraceae bacterium]|nr:CDP-diacylglycerol--serine O-phosphatidyltransferase [Bryobacteraceae bacterium]
MPRFNIAERLIDPKSPDRRPRRAAYALPTLFTAGNLLLGFLAIMETFRGSMEYAQHIPDARLHFELAAIYIGISVFVDGLDGRIARMTNTVSDFGREMDSLADVISFGIAPGVLAFAWGVQFVDWSILPDSNMSVQLRRATYFVTFLFLLCGASRLARFNISVNPIPKNPGRPGRKYFVGLPIPAAAGMVAAVVYALDSKPLHHWLEATLWMGLIGLLAFLMVCTWRYRSFKDFNLLSPRSFKSVITLGSMIFLLFNFSQPVLLAMATTYVASGILVRIGGLLSRRSTATPSPETQVG